MEAIEEERKRDVECNQGIMSTNREHCRQSIESIPGERDLLAVINSNLVIREELPFFPRGSTPR